MTNALEVPSSWRDPSGIVFSLDGRIHRAVACSYASDYGLLMSSGLYRKLSSAGKLITHRELDPFSPFDEGFHRILLPEQIPVITYPYEWCFSQLKDAALLTLEIQREALDFGMSLKDANAFNIQFLNGRPILIDTLSFEKYVEGTPWVAYRQFCAHFLAPLCLTAFTHRLSQKILLAFPDGLPLSLASAALPLYALARPSVFMHLYLHSAVSDYAAAKGPDKRRGFLRKSAVLRIVEGLHSAIQGLKWKHAGSHWQTYYSTCSYSGPALEHKRSIVRDFLAEARPRSVWDFGANTGEFSLLAAGMGFPTVALDSDPGCVELIYQKVRKESVANLLPVVADLVWPSPSLGWSNEERSGILDRCRPDMIMALALLHHLALGKNVPFEKLAHLLARLAGYSIVEFVPKDDPQSMRLLAHRRDIFPDYSQEKFEQVFERFFEVRSKVPLIDNPRCLYLMRRREGYQGGGTRPMLSV